MVTPLPVLGYCLLRHNLQLDMKDKLHCHLTGCKENQHIALRDWITIPQCFFQLELVKIAQAGGRGGGGWGGGGWWGGFRGCRGGGGWRGVIESV